MTWDPNKKMITVAEVLDLYPRLGVPHFQRGLVWGNDTVASLLESLFYDTPCGSFVFWDSGANHDHGVPMPNGATGGINYLVVDGQQRIRSLRQIFHNEGEGDIDDTGTTDSEDDERDDAKAWCINLTQHKDFRDLLEQQNREYALFVYTTRPEKANSRSPLRHNVLPLDTLLAGGLAYDHLQHLRFRSGKQDSDVAGILQSLKKRLNDILRREFFVTVKNDSPAEVINLYNRINSGGKRVEVEEKAFARLVSLYPPSYRHVAKIFSTVHDKTTAEGQSASDYLNRDDVMERQKENRFGFKLFIRTFIQVSNYHLCRSAGSQYLSFNVVHSDSFAELMSGNDSKKIEFLWKETLEVLATARNLLKQELYIDDLAFLPDTMSLVPVFQMLIQFPELREPQYRPVLGWVTLALLLANLDGDEILGLVATLRDDGELGADVLPEMLKGLDVVARRKIRSPQTLESASSIQNRYVLMLYGLLRRKGIRDFSYRNVTQATPLSGKGELSICEACYPEKQHIAPFSCLLNALGDKDAKRGSNHRFNNIGNLTYISSVLNHYETGLGATPIDRSLDPIDNLEAHYLSDDEHLGKAGQLYDELKHVLCDTEGSPVETIDRLFEKFCKARRRLIAEGFLSWLDELNRRAVDVMPMDDLQVKTPRFKAITPQCIERQYLPLTQQIRSMNYSGGIEDALINYVRNIEKHHDMRKRRKFLQNEVELRLSGGGAIRLLLSSSGIQVVYHDWITKELSAPADSMIGISPEDRRIYQQQRGGALTLELLNKASEESERLDRLEQQQRELVRHKKKGVCDPAFTAVIDTYNQTAEKQWQTRGQGRTYRQVYPDHWDDGVHYEFCNDDDSVGVVIHLESEEVRGLGPLLSPFSGKELVPGILIDWDPRFSRNRGSLNAEVKKDQPPEVAAHVMKELIALTSSVIEKYLNQ